MVIKNKQRNNVKTQKKSYRFDNVKTRKKTLAKIFQFFENSPFPFRTAKRRGIFLETFKIVYFIDFFWILCYVEPSYY